MFYRKKKSGVRKVCGTPDFFLCWGFLLHIEPRKNAPITRIESITVVMRASFSSIKSTWQFGNFGFGTASILFSRRALRLSVSEEFHCVFVRKL